MTPEQKARVSIDTLLAAAGWHVCNVSSANLHAATGVALNYEEMRKFASGEVQPNLNLSLVRAVCVPLPPRPEQVRIVAEVDRHLSIIREVEAEVDANLLRAQSLRQAVLSQSFR